MSMHDDDSLRLLRLAKLRAESLKAERAEMFCSLVMMMTVLVNTLHFVFFQRADEQRKFNATCASCKIAVLQASAASHTVMI